MTNEKMLEYLMLDKLLYTPEGNSSELATLFIEEDTLDKMIERRIYLEDKFINEYKPTRPIIKDPVKDATAKEE